MKVSVQQEASRTEFLVRCADKELPALLEIPANSRALVLIVHGRSAGILSPRGAACAAWLHGRGTATLRFGLRLPEESSAPEASGLPVLVRRVIAATGALRSRAEARELPLGYQGAGTAVAAVLSAAAELGEGVRAVVSVGGRPDLAGAALARVLAPTLLLVGSRAPRELQLNRQAQRLLPAESRLAVISGAGPRFEEPGTLERAASEAGRWFEEKLRD